MSVNSIQLLPGLRKVPRFISTMLLATAPACSPHVPQNGNSPVEYTANEIDPIIRKLMDSANYASRRLSQKELNDMVRTPYVLDSFLIQRQELATALLCQRLDHSAEASDADIMKRIREIGVDPHTIRCPTRRSTTDDSQSVMTSGDTAREPYSVEILSGTSVYATIAPAVCTGAVQPGSAPRDPVRRRWANDLRILTPADPNIRAELEKIIGDKRLRKILGPIALRLVEEHPNVVFQGMHRLENAYAHSEDRPAKSHMSLPGARRPECVLTSRFKSYDAFADKITSGRRTYTKDGSDFSAVAKGSNARGFTISGPDGNIDAAVCLLPEEAMGISRSGIEYSPPAKSFRVVDCIARILGIGGQPKSLIPSPGSFRPDLVTVSADGEIRLSSVSYQALAYLY